MEIMLKNKCCLYVIISIRFFSITIVTYLLNRPRIFHGLSISEKTTAFPAALLQNV